MYFSNTEFKDKYKHICYKIQYCNVMVMRYNETKFAINATIVCTSMIVFKAVLEDTKQLYAMHIMHAFVNGF